MPAFNTLTLLGKVLFSCTSVSFHSACFGCRVVFFLCFNSSFIKFRYEEVVRKLNNVYIFMEYAAGGDLASQLSKRARSRDYLSEEIVLVWSNHILHALAYMHRRGMVHR